jgi:hypothetical protein
VNGIQAGDKKEASFYIERDGAAADREGRAGDRDEGASLVIAESNRSTAGEDERLWKLGLYQIGTAQIEEKECGDSETHFGEPGSEPGEGAKRRINSGVRGHGQSSSAPNNGSVVKQQRGNLRRGEDNAAKSKASIKIYDMGTYSVRN